MTTVVLVVLGLVWGLVLFLWLRSRSAAGAFTDSVTRFRRDLRMLERTSPVRVQPANRLRSGYVAGRASLRAVSDSSVQPGLRPPTTASIRRRQSQKRRRDVLLVLMAITGLSMLAAAYTKDRDAIIAMALAILLLSVYVALLARMGSLAAERAKKLTYLSQARRDAAGRAPAKAWATQGRSARRRVGGDDAPGRSSEADPVYRQLAMRRVAN